MTKFAAGYIYNKAKKGAGIGHIFQPRNRNQFLNKKSLIGIFSSYAYNGIKFWVITEADRSATTILLPGEY